MPLLEFLVPDAVVCSLRARSKKQVLQDLAAQSVRHLPMLSDRAVFETLLQRERLGSTGIGEGVAIPHGKLPGLTRLYGLFARLATPIDFESIDERPVDLIFLLLAPEGAGADHLKALARVSRLLRDQSVCEKLRKTDNPEALFILLTESAASSHAA